MSSKPLVVRYDIHGVPFAVQLLAADDFDVATLKHICRDLGINQVGKKNILLGYIESFLTSDRDLTATNPILFNLIRRSKKWFTFKQGKIAKFPSLNNPAEIIYSEGTEEWYGPINLPEDPSGNWYIRPSFIPHWEIDIATKKPILRQIRWLLFAKVTGELISYHWHGFSYSVDQNSTERESQFPYWNYIPNLVDEFEKILGQKLEYPNLHEFILIRLWDFYRTKEDYAWNDIRIRAESGGVSLSAKSGGISDDVEIDVRGISHLANILALSVVKELGITLDMIRQRHLQESILQTIIRHFGAKSYEFSLVDNSTRLLKSHIYFGMKPGFPGPDSFPHVNCHTTWKNDQDQLDYIVEQIKTLPQNVNDQPNQLGLL
jgi:hypothetical protein